MQTIALEMDKQWDSAVYHRELYLVTCDPTWWIMWEKECVCVCVYIYVCIYIYIMFVWLGHFAVQQKLIDKCKSTIIKK